jgi:glycosyltransferase involved in cell wall biosynthesis
MGPGGAERVTSILTRRWVNAGHAVKVITLAEPEHDAYQLDPRVERESLRAAMASKGIWKAIGSNFLRVRALRRSLKNFEADVAIGMMSTALTLLAFASIGLPWTTVGAARIHPPMERLPRTWLFLRRFSYRLLDVVIAQTTESARWIEGHAGVEAVRVIPNPLEWPLEAEPPLLSPALVCPPDRLIVLAVGRLVPQKGFARLMDAFAAIHADHPTWDLVILGAGPDKQRLEAQRDKLGLNGHVFLPGRAGNVGDWYKHASIFAMASLFEGFPNALLEAMAHGLPVISMDCDTGPRDIIVNGVNGLLVRSGDRDAFAQGLRQLMENGNLRQQLSVKACDVITEYSADHISRQWLDIFDEQRNPASKQR